MNQFLVFSLGNSEFAVPLLRVKTVVTLSTVASVPYMPPHFKGLINLRGEIIAVINPKFKMGIQDEASAPEPSVIIFDHGDQVRGMAVDSVNRVFSMIEGNETASPTLIDIDSTLNIGVA